ncbi:MAG: hypothetical protein IKH84_05695 [Ottowia sp.]|nr:hypothetical protein [Ottowia sp.]
MAEIAFPATVLHPPLAAGADSGNGVFFAEGRWDIPGAAVTLAELAVDKTSAGEAPHVGARVMVLRLLDGKKVWEGFADAEGRWQADGLQHGFEYVAVGIDPQRVFKTTAAGPVKASAEGA